MDLLDDDLFLEPAVTNAKGGGKFQPKVKPRPKKIAKIGQLVDVVDDKSRKLVGSSTEVLGVPNTDETPAMDSGVLLSDGTKNLESEGQIESVERDLNPFDDTLPEHVMKNGEKHAKPDTTVSNTANDVEFSSIAASEIQGGNEDSRSCGIVNASTSVACSTSETADGCFGLEGLEDFVTQPSSGMDPNSSKPQALAETSQLDDAMMNDALQSDDVPLAKMGFKRGKRKIPTVSDPAQKSKASSAVGEEENAGKSSMQLRKCSDLCLIDELVDEAHDNTGYAEVEDGDDEWREGGEFKKIRAPRRKSVADAEKPARKRKKANKETDQPPKKFSHSTRRTRRQVDRALLETPEEELEPTNMPIKDLITFYLHKEKMEDKETKSKKSSSNASTQNDASHNEEDVFGTERYSDSMNDDEGGNPVEITTSPPTNYHSHMDETSRSKWSKQDDELFYKCIRQFGIDLSMIQLLFPDRTRRQIKLKMKKEERQHPLRLTEAVQNRAKDHTQFEMMVEQIKKTEAEEEAEEFDGSVTGEEEDIAPENDDESTKPEKEETNNSKDEAEEESTLKFDEIDDDFDFEINEYKSEY